MIYQHEGAAYSVQLRSANVAVIGDREVVFTSKKIDGGWLLTLGGQQVTVYAATRGSERFLSLDGETYRLSVPEGRRAARSGGGDLTAQMPGQVREVLVQAGDAVRRGQTLLLLEAMKMETRVTAPADGTVKRVLVKLGEVVDRGQRLVEMETGEQRETR